MIDIKNGAMHPIVRMRGFFKSKGRNSTGPLTIIPTHQWVKFVLAIYAVYTLPH